MYVSTSTSWWVAAWSWQERRARSWQTTGSTPAPLRLHFGPQWRRQKRGAAPAYFDLEAQHCCRLKTPAGNWGSHWEFVVVLATQHTSAEILRVASQNRGAGIPNRDFRCSGRPAPHSQGWWGSRASSQLWTPPVGTSFFHFSNCARSNRTRLPRTALKAAEVI